MTVTELRIALQRFEDKGQGDDVVNLTEVNTSEIHPIQDLYNCDGMITVVGPSPKVTISVGWLRKFLADLDDTLPVVISYEDCTGAEVEDGTLVLT